LPTLEHVRTVHFALTATAVILTFLTFSRRPSGYEEAQKQLVGIQRVDREQVKNIVSGALRSSAARELT
jgi:hypothetical protein